MGTSRTKRWSWSCLVAAMLATVVVASPPATAGEPPPSVPTPDFDGNGTTDVFWYAPGAAADELWQWNGQTFGVVPMSVSGTYEQLFLDVEGDGDTDVFWYAPGPRSDYLWRATDAGFVSSPHPVNGSYRPLVLDRDGDGGDEIFWYAAGSRSDHLWTWNGAGFASQPVGVRGSYEPVVADLDGDGGDDVFWYAAGSPPDYLWSWDDGALDSRRLPVSGSYEPFTADADGDGDAEIFWYAPGGAKDYRWDLTSGSVSSIPFQLDGVYDPLVGDFDADGVDEVFLHADGSAADFLWQLHAGEPLGDFAALADSGIGVAPLVGDFDGDRATDVIFARPDETAVSWWRGGASGFDVSQVVVEGSSRVPPGSSRAPVSSTHVVGNRTMTINVFLPVGSAEGVTLLHPVGIVERVGWHQAYAGNQPSQITPAPTAINPLVLPSRGRGTGRQTAADIPVDPHTRVWASETGTVARAGTYNLRETNGRLHPDIFVVIRPDSNPAKEVTMLHMVGLRVQPGDRVEAGVTTVADHSRTFPFVSQVDDYTASPSWPHIHLEIRSYKGSSVASTSGDATPAEVVPNTPAATTDSTMCEDEATGTFEPCGDD